MAEGGSDEVVEKTVCGICSENYRHPKLLPCYHSFCLNCLENLVTSKLKENKFDCPLCETTIELPEGGVKDFPRNYYVGSNSRISDDEKHDCDLCGPEVNAVNLCTECDENYCERCTDMHLKQKATRNHTLISLGQAGSDRIGPVKKKMFCEKHPNDEVRVVCKDCDKLLCIICKLTDHEKHNSRDITDEAEIAKGKLRENVKGAEKSISQLEKLLDSLTVSKQENCSRRKSQVNKMQNFKHTIINTFESKVKELEMLLSRNFENMKSNIVKRSSNIEVTIASLSHIIQYANALTSVSDNGTLLAISQDVQMRMTDCTRKADKLISINKEQIKHILQWSDVCTNDTLMKLVGITVINENIKEVSKIGSCSFGNANSDNVSSICVFQKGCVASFTDDERIAITSGPTVLLKTFHQSGKALSCVERDNICYSDITSREVKVCDIRSRNVVKLYESDMYPHGIAYRMNKDLQAELLVCLLNDDSELMTTCINKGQVRAIPVEHGKPAYDFLAETSPAPTRVAVNQSNGIVCLGYPSIAKVSVHGEDGSLLYVFGDNDLRLVRPFGICFDNENCVVIADRDGGQVLRVTMFGKLVQVLVKGNKPTAVAVGPDDKLWVGYEDINVTVYQMANEAQ